MFTVENSSTSVIIGRAGENVFRSIEIDVSDWQKKYPNSRISAVFERPDGVMYPVEIERHGAVVRWRPTNKDTYAGKGKLELRLHHEDTLGKSAVFYTMCSTAIPYPDDEPAVQNKANMVLMWTETGPAWKELEYQVGGESYELTVATDTVLGGIMADSREEGDTQPVRIGSDNKLYTAPAGSGGVSDYTELENKPSINGVELFGDQTSTDLGIGDPTDEQVTTAVDAWLDAHPEATTTVTDRSITCDKIHDAVIYHQVFDLDDLLANYTLNSSSNQFIISPYWEVYPETVYTMNFRGTYCASFSCYDENKTRLGSAAVDATTFQFTTLANTKYITFQDFIGEDKSVMATRYANAMICKGDKLYDDFFIGKRYSLSDLMLHEMISQLAEGVVDGTKIAPKTIEKNRLSADFQISPDEIKGINLKNLFDANDYAYATEDTDNVKVGFPGNWSLTGYRTLIVPCKPNTTYYLYRHNGTEAVKLLTAVYCYDANMKQISNVVVTDFSFTTPDSTAFILPWFLGTNAVEFNNTVSTIMLTTYGVTDRYYPYTAEPDWLNLMAKKGTEELSVLCYGDSLTSGKYPSRVADLLGCKVVDAGVGGNTCAGIADRVGNYGTDFDVVTLMVGTNDNGGQTSCPLGTADDEAATDDNATAAETTYAARLKRLLNKIKATHRGATFVIMPPFQHSWGASTFEPVSELMGEIAKQYKMPYLDIYHLCGWDGTDAEDVAIFMADQTHENDVGAQRIAELLAGFIKQLKGA